MDEYVIEFLDECFFGIFEDTGAEVEGFECKMVGDILEGGRPGGGIVGGVVEEEVGSAEG